MVLRLGDAQALEPQDNCGHEEHYELDLEVSSDLRTFKGFPSRLATGVEERPLANTDSSVASSIAQPLEVKGSIVES